MNKYTFPEINEAYYRQVLENGLEVILIPKAGFTKTYGIFTTYYGSIDETFIPLGKKEPITVPEGVAHFLEHKMFEKEDGDVFQVFSKLGASANAFTSFTKTSYLFSATESIEENLETLLNFVQSPYFTKETVEKEKGIIAQEIQMYQDDPQWRLFFQTLQNLYPKHPLHIDIAGTVASIQEITPENLYECYETFYHPSNMTLVLVGNLKPTEMMAFIEENQQQKSFLPKEKLVRFYPEETATDIVPEKTFAMEVTVPKMALGIKGFDEVPEEPLAQMRYCQIGNFLLEAILGETSQAYLELYNEGLLDDSFGYEFNVDRTFHFADFSGDSEKPKELMERLKDILFTEKAYLELTEEKLALLKKRALGKYLQALNSLEYTANQFFQTTRDASGISGTLYERPQIIESITLAELKEFAKIFLKEEHSTEVYLEKR